MPCPALRPPRDPKHEHKGTLLSFWYYAFREVELVFDDLLLDAVVSPNGEVCFEDEDELAAAIAAGQLSTAQIEVVNAARHALQQDTGTLTSTVDLEVDKAIQARREELALLVL